MAAKAKQVTAEFEVERETKGTKRFSETEEDRDKQMVGKIYVKHGALKKIGDPETIKVTIEPA